MKKWIQSTALYWAWVIVLVGCCVSLFYGEILGHEPCSLCWYQRIALFPLVILLGIAAYRGDRRIIPYVLPIVALGFCIALFHLLQLVMLQEQACTLCSQQELGFIFPLGSALSFFLVGVLLLVAFFS